VTATPSVSLADSSLAELAARVASDEPAPGAGPSSAWTCALAAALVEMVSAVALRNEPDDADAAERRRVRAGALRERALELADEDVVAYTAVLTALGGPGGAGRGAAISDALSQAADPPLAIAETAAAAAELAADAAAEARGAVKGEAITAAVLAEAVVRACASIVDMNLGGAPGDARRARVRELADAARTDLARASA
jgi:formiminotetrahydrofolate cyclodeaminase